MNLWWAAAIVVGTALVAAGVLLVVRRFAPHGGHFGDTSRAAGVFSILATFFAVLFAFMIYLAFSAYDATDDGADAEADAVLQQFETAQLLPAEARPRLGGELLCYARSVVHEEWPAMADGHDPDINRWGAALFETFRTVEPVTPGQQAAYAQWLDHTTAREEGRIDRIEGATGVVPSTLWFVLWISSGVVLAFVFFFADRGEGAFVQAVQVGLVTALLTAGMLTLFFLDRPHRPGPGAIEPTAMERSVRVIEESSALLDLPLVVPCDELGRARP